MNELVSEHGRRHLRSASYRTLAVPRTRTTLGDRSFAVAGPRVWNSLPTAIRQITSYAQFRQHLNNKKRTNAFHSHYTGQPALAGTSSEELADFVGAKFYCPHALADGNRRIRIREKTLEFSSTLSLYLHLKHLETHLFRA